MLSEAKHLGLFPLLDRPTFNLRFFASLRMTFRDGLDLLLLAFFQQNAQFSNRFTIFWSVCCFLDTNQCREIDAFESHAKSIDVERIRQQVAVTFATSYFAKEIDVTQLGREREI